MDIFKKLIINTIGKKNKMYQLALYMCEPLAMALFNSLLIPTLVYWSNEYLFFEQKSIKTNSRLKKYFFYLMIIVIILPLTNLNDI
jgi:hypothetical protein